MKLSEIITFIEDEWINIEKEIRDIPPLTLFKRRVLALTMQKIEGGFDPMVASNLVDLAYRGIYG